MPVIRQIPQAHPDAIFSTIVGNTNISFFADLRKLGITPARLPVSPAPFIFAITHLRNL